MQSYAHAALHRQGHARPAVGVRAQNWYRPYEQMAVARPTVSLVVSHASDRQRAGELPLSSKQHGGGAVSVWRRISPPCAMSILIGLPPSLSRRPRRFSERVRRSAAQGRGAQLANRAPSGSSGLTPLFWARTSTTRGACRDEPAVDAHARAHDVVRSSASRACARRAQLRARAAAGLRRLRAPRAPVCAARSQAHAPRAAKSASPRERQPRSAHPRVLAAARRDGGRAALFRREGREGRPLARPQTRAGGRLPAARVARTEGHGGARPARERVFIHVLKPHAGNGASTRGPRSLSSARARPRAARVSRRVGAARVASQHRRSVLARSRARS